jgi:hypothetical protein
MLNIAGIIFAIQFVTLLMVGAYADYGKWRPWVMIGELVCDFTHQVHGELIVQVSWGFAMLVNSPSLRSTSRLNGSVLRSATLSVYTVRPGPICENTTD